VAGRPRLNASRGLKLAALAVLVLLAHGVFVDWVGRALQQQSILKPMAKPMLTRLLRQEAPAPVPGSAAAVVQAPSRPTITSLRKKAARPAKAASAPSDARPAQDVRPEPAADVASTPVPPAAEAPPAAASESVPAVAAASSPASAATAAASAASAASAPQQAYLDAWPADTRLNYRLSGWFRGELYGSARVQWQRQQEKFQARIEIEVTPFANITMTSQGEVTAAGLAPRVYEEQRRSGPRGVRIEGDSLLLSDGRRLPKPDRVQDTASQFVELSHRFATGQEKLEVGRAVQVWLARPGGVDLWTYDIVGREVLSSRELGAIDTFHLKPRPIPNPRGTIEAEMWFAPSLQLLPVRIKVNMGPDTWVDLMVQSIEQR
jgi:hypothetical protein